MGKPVSDAARKAAEEAVDAWEEAEGETMRDGPRSTLERVVAAAIDSETAARQPAPAPDAEAEAWLDEIRAAYQRSGKHAQITGDDIGLLLATLRRTQEERDAVRVMCNRAMLDLSTERDAAYQRGREERGADRREARPGGRWGHAEAEAPDWADEVAFSLYAMIPCDEHCAISCPPLPCSCGAEARGLKQQADVATALREVRRAGREDAAQVADRVALEFHERADVERGQGARAIADGLAAKGEGAEAVARAIRGGERG